MSIMKKLGRTTAKKVSAAKGMRPGVSKPSTGAPKKRMLSPGMRKAIGGMKSRGGAKKIKGY